MLCNQGHGQGICVDNVQDLGVGMVEEGADMADTCVVDKDGHVI